MTEQNKEQGQELQEVVKEIVEAKEQAIKFNYGIGGQTFSIFPILLDKAQNAFLETVTKDITPGKVNGTTLEKWAKENGELKLIPVIAGNKVYYTVAIVAAKQFNLPTWELEWGTGENYLTYTVAKESGKKQVKAGEMAITNISTNKGKAINQAKALGKLFKMDFSKVEEAAKGNHYQLDTKTGELVELGKNSGKPTGNKLQTIGNLPKWQTWDNMVKEFSRAR